ncbi:unnamed protein product, partial [Aureobasidium vineae]
NYSMGVLKFTFSAAFRPSRCSFRSVTKRWNSVSQRPGSDRVRFPGAIDSKFTTNLDFTRPANKKAMPTYRILDQDGVIVDKSREPSDISDDHLIKMYKDMLSVSSKN